MKSYGAIKRFFEKIRYDQTNNIIEFFLKKTKLKGLVKFWLESCNVEALATAIEAVDGVWLKVLEKICGIIFEGYGDRMFSFLNSPKVQKLLPARSSKIPSNEFMENLAFVAPIFASVNAKIIKTDFLSEVPGLMRKSLAIGAALVLSYEWGKGAGHYITVVGYDEEKAVFQCYDSWPGNKYCKNNGILEEYDDKFFTTKMKDRKRFLEITKKA